ncbi:MAG: hypothetical protein ABGY75_09355 [Gemmataceae bacterium]
MLRSIAFALLTALALPTVTPVVRADDKVIGAVWEIFVKGKDRKYTSYCKLRATTDGKVYEDGKVVGTHTSSGDEFVMLITKSATEGHNGTMKGTKVDKAGKVYEGTHTSKEGKETPIRMKLVAD